MRLLIDSPGSFVRDYLHGQFRPIKEIRQMAQAKAKSNSVVTTEWSGDILTIEVLGAGAIMFDRTAASADNRDWAEKHGWTQRLSNRAAISAPTRKAGVSDSDWAV